ncbi:hypothetical protein B0T18DRAFT_397158 [Schizothecium vesticola]|uniref:Uncharacterized protein n=1 Tax=Schizothecium vesticola TaxID=314040 RepID=A0AA40KCA1_9PEZI|nr:hypothetical protein B0T18DRAFT_397158 [Schizothecium vesticola]
MPTILTELGEPNPVIDSTGLTQGSNTLNPRWHDVGGWSIWQEFNYKTLGSIFGHIVNAEWKDPLRVASGGGGRLDSEIYDEDQLEHQILSRHTIPIVNDALAHANRVLGLKEEFVLHLGRRGRCTHEQSGDGREFPDWTLVSPRRRAEYLDDNGHRFLGKYYNLLPGDTKISSKWSPSLYTERRARGNQWEWPVRQVLTYASSLDVRYGYLLTDKHLVVFQFAREAVGSGLSAGREQRVVPAAMHARAESGSTDLSTTFQTMSISSTQYSNRNPTTDFEQPKYQVIDWISSGKGVLTVKLALFYLCLMAGHGPSNIQTSYPRLNSWCRLENGTFRHNTSGRTAIQLGSKDRVEDADPQRVPDPIDYSRPEGEEGREAGKNLEEEEGRQAGENLEEEECRAGGGGSGRAGKAPDVGGDDESRAANEEAYDLFFWYESTRFLKRRAVEGLRWDAARGLFHFQDEDGEVVFVDEHMTIYDEEAESWGYFYGNKWVPAHLDPSGAGEPNTKKEHKRRRMR